MTTKLRAFLGAERRAGGTPIVLVWIALALAVAVVAAPLLVGARTLFLRDVLGIHFPLKAFGAAQLAEGRIPAFDPSLGLGQTFRGNPQALAFYPDNLLYLALPIFSAFNAHFVLHWLAGFLGMRALARAYGQSRPAALLAALTYAAGGWFLSMLSFYNLVTVAACWPWVLWGARRGAARGVAAASLACGLALLGGEPVTAALGLAPLALVAIETAGWRRGSWTVAVIVGAGALVALPQIVATARILPFTFRGAHGVIAAMGTVYRFHPARLLELVLPLPFGWPGRGGALGWWAFAVAPRPPLVFSVYGGLVGLWLAARAGSARRTWQVLALGGLVAAAAGGLAVQWSGGLFRFPEKFLFWTALAGALLAGWGCDRVLGRASGEPSGAAASPSPSSSRPAAALAIGLLVAGAVLLILRLAAGSAVAPLWQVQGLLWALAMLVGAALWLLALSGARRGRAGIVVAAQALTLAQLWPLLPTVPTAPLAAPGAWAERVGRAAALNTALVWPEWEGVPPVALSPAECAATLGATPNVRFGVRYPVASDFEGMGSPLQDLLLINLSRFDWVRRVAWLRTLGVEHVVAFAPLAVPGLRPVAELPVQTGRARLLDVESAAPAAWWPDRVEEVPTPLEALAGVARAVDPTSVALVATRVEHRSGGRVRVLAESADRVELEVESPGGLLVVQRNFDPLWRARASDGRRLRVVAADLVLTGVEVPAGTTRVTLSVAWWPEGLAGLLALVAVATLVRAVVRDRAMGELSRA
jgi:hypothetical protein